MKLPGLVIKINDPDQGAPPNRGIPAGSDRTGEAVNALAVLCQAASVPRLVARLGNASPSLGQALPPARCHGAPAINIGSYLMGGADQVAYGTLAHELAHHEAGDLAANGRARVRIFLTFIAVFALTAFIPVISRYSVVFTLAVFAVLAAYQGQVSVRRQEYRADARGAELLDAAGYPGTECMTALLAGFGHESRVKQYAIAAVTGHPPVSRRLAAMRKRAS